MKKTLYVVISILVVLLVLWLGFDYFRTRKNADEAKRVFQNYVSTNYTESELPSANDRLTMIAMGNPELFVNLVSEAVIGPNKQSMPTNKVRALLDNVAYSATVGRNEKVFDILLRIITQLIKSDPQNTDHYLDNIEKYFMQSTHSCVGSLGDFRTKSMLERCNEKNTPYILVYNFLGKYGDLIDKKLIQCATNITLGDGLSRGVLFPHFWVLALRQKYGNNITAEVLKNDPIIQKIGGNIPNELKKELGM